LRLVYPKQPVATVAKGSETYFEQKIDRGKKRDIFSVK